MLQLPFIKRILPKSLFGRALLILIIPTVLLQMVAIYIFYENHWDSITRQLSTSLAGEVTHLVQLYDTLEGDEQQVFRVQEVGNTMGFRVQFDMGKQYVIVKDEGADAYPEFFKQMELRIDEPFMVQRIREGDDLLISVQKPHGILQMQTTKKRLVSTTTYVFILWMVGSSILLLIIAVLFLRNQVRPIRQLAVAAERFGMGLDTPKFSPRGAREIRQAGRAFLVMQRRIIRQVTHRTEMLAGISHDLRTPLTRMKLQLAMGKPDEQTLKDLRGDVEEMEYMIQEYLDFARGEGQETSLTVNVEPFLQEIIERYQRNAQPVTLEPLNDISLPLRPNAMRRALQNVIDNALRYGKQARIHVTSEDYELRISIDDEGPGINEEDHNTVFRAFKRLDPSRNNETGGAGLGLTIARDIVQGHGGDVVLKNREDSEGKRLGLRVSLILPMARQQPAH